MRTDFRQVDVDDVAQFLLRVMRDANGGRIAFQKRPIHVLWCSGKFRDTSFRPLVERRLDRFGFDRLIADLNFDFAPGLASATGR